MPIRCLLPAALLLAAWADQPPPQPYAHMPDQHRPLPQAQPRYQQPPQGPAHGSIWRCLELRAKGWENC